MNNAPGFDRPGMTSPADAGRPAGKVGVYERPKRKGGMGMILFGILLLAIAAVLWFLFFNNR